MNTVFFAAGAMLAICDVNEYRKCVREFHIPLVIELFDTLHALCNLLVVVPDNLKQVSHGDQLVSVSVQAILFVLSSHISDPVNIVCRC